MIRRLLLVFSLIMMPLALVAQESGDNEPNNVAQGSEKAAHKVAHPEESHEGGPGHAPKTYFGIPGWVLKLLNMILFIGLLVYLLGGPLKASMGERGAMIRKEAEESRARRAKADQLASDIQARLSQIEQDIKSIHERAKIEGERQKQEIIAAAEVDAKKILEAARNEVDNRLKHAKRELTEYAAELAAERAESILREKITPEDQKKLFKESVAEVEGRA